MWWRRLVAVLVAAALVLGALLLRDRRTEGRADGGSDDGAVDTDVRVTCVTELDDVCAQLDATVDTAPAVETVEELASPSGAVDVWVTVEPWPEIADVVAGGAAAPVARSEVLARSPVLLAASAERAAALTDACGGALAWPCLGEQVGRSWEELGGVAGWGDVEMGLGRPDQTAAGLLALGQGVSAVAGDAALTTRSLEQPPVGPWLRSLARSVEEPPDGDPFGLLVTTGAAAVEFAPVLEQRGVALLRRRATAAEDLELRALSPTVTADVVVAAYSDAGRAAIDGVATQMREPLAEAGWRGPTGGEAPSELASLSLPEGNGAPPAAALEALRRSWTELTR